MNINNYTPVELGLAYAYVSESPYMSYEAIELLVGDHGNQIIMGLAGLMYTAETCEALQTNEVKLLIGGMIDIGGKQAEHLMYYAPAFPVNDNFVSAYFDGLTLSETPSKETPHIIHKHCLYRTLPLERAEQIAERMISSGLYHTYLIPELCAKGVIQDENLI